MNTAATLANINLINLINKSINNLSMYRMYRSRQQKTTTLISCQKIKMQILNNYTELGVI